MTIKYHYQEPELEQLPISYNVVLCQSDDLSGDTQDYDLVEGFEW